MKKKKNELDDFLGEWEEILSLQPFFQPKTTNTQVQSTTSNNQSVTTNSSNNTQSSTQTNVLQTNNNTFNKRPLRSFSIKDSINKKEEEIKLEEARLKALAKNENFSQDELIRCWNQYIKGLTEQQILKNTMMTCKPILEDNFKISIHVDNSVQKELLEIESINLTNHLRENLNNGKIEMEIFVNEMGENIKTKTTYELFAELKESSPEFNRFSELLQLEIE